MTFTHIDPKSDTCKCCRNPEPVEPVADEVDEDVAVCCFCRHDVIEFDDTEA